MAQKVRGGREVAERWQPPKAIEVTRSMEYMSERTTT
jgi:hypothetical protein